MSTLAIYAFGACLAAPRPVAPPAEPLVEGRPLSHWVDAVRKGDVQSPSWQKAARALQSAKEVAIPRLLPLLDDKDGGVRLRALLILKDMPPLSEDVVAAFIKAARDPDPGNRMIAVNGLGRPAVARKGVVPALLVALRDPSPYTRAMAAGSLGTLGGDATSAIGALTVALADEKAIVRDAAKDALRKIHGAGSASDELSRD